MCHVNEEDEERLYRGQVEVEERGTSKVIYKFHVEGRTGFRFRHGLNPVE